MKNLKALAKIRSKAERIKKNKNFIRQYRNIINPILEKYKQKIVRDSEMYFEIKKAIKKIKHIANNCQYIPNCPPNRKNYKSPDFSEHNLLLAVEKECQEVLMEMKTKLLN